MTYNLREKIYLVGYCSNQMVATENLPTIRQVLAVLFYNLRRISSTFSVSAKLAIEECLIIWKKAHITTKRNDKCIEQLKAEYDRWREMQKSAKRGSDFQIKKEKIYEQSIDKLFDIASANALELMENESDKQFLVDQRALEKSDDLSSSIKHANTNEPLPMEIGDEDSNAKTDETLPNVESDKVIDSSVALQNKNLLGIASKELINEFIGPESESPASQSTPPPKRRGLQFIMTPRLATALDKCKVSKRNAMHLLMAVAEAFGVDVRNFVLNSTSIHEARQKLRKERCEAIKKFAPDLFSGLPSTIHFDGKILPDLSRNEASDRLAIFITCGEIEQLLGVPKISTGTGANQAQAVFEVLTDWSLVDNIESLGCDSTASNTGCRNGACVLLEGLIGKELLWLICRRHMYEIVLKAVFEIIFGKSTGPDVKIFKDFGNSWKSIDQTKYECGIDDSFVSVSLQDVRDRTLNFCSEFLEKDLVRSDYREFLELLIIFLGGELPYDVKFHPPGAIHQARWMAKAIYCLKMFLFRKQFFLNSKDDEVKCREVCMFIVRIYVQAWFRAPFAAQAPIQDLNFLKSLYNYSNINQSISDAAVKKFRCHLWYLTPEISALAFFDTNISREEKLNMCQALQSSSSAFAHDKRVLGEEKFVKITRLVNSNICDFICQDSYKFFERFKIDTAFLKKDPTYWKNDRNYRHGLKIVQNLKVVNDVAERGVKLMAEFNNLLTKDSEQTQYLLPVINDYRSLFPDSTKNTLIQSYK